MRTGYLVSLTLPLLSLSGSAQAGLFDRLKGSASSISSSVADAVPSPAGAAAPSPPAEPSLDAFGGSGVQPTQAGSGKGRAAAPAQPGQIIYERVPGEPDPKVVNQVETAVPTQEAHEPYDGTEYRWKMFAVSCEFGRCSDELLDVEGWSIFGWIFSTSLQ